MQAARALANMAQSLKDELPPSSAQRIVDTLCQQLPGRLWEVRPGQSSLVGTGVTTTYPYLTHCATQGFARGAPGGAPGAMLSEDLLLVLGSTPGAILTENLLLVQGRVALRECVALGCATGSSSDANHLFACDDMQPLPFLPTAFLCTVVLQGKEGLLSSLALVCQGCAPVLLKLPPSAPGAGAPGATSCAAQVVAAVVGACERKKTAFRTAAYAALEKVKLVAHSTESIWNVLLKLGAPSDGSKCTRTLFHPNSTGACYVV